MPTVLIDTDVAIDYLRGIPYTKSLLIPLWQSARCFMSILSVYELFAGMQSEERIVTQNFVAACCIESVDLTIAERAALHYQSHRKKGLTLTTVDCLIYATAILRDHKIATKNIRHYPDKDALFEF